jgi:hypothetical protein
MLYSFHFKNSFCLHYKNYKMKKNIAILFMILFLSSKTFCQSNEQIVNTLSRLIEDRKTKFKNTRDTFIKKDEVENISAYRCTETFGAKVEVIMDEDKYKKSYFFCGFNYNNFNKPKIDSIKNLINIVYAYVDSIIDANKLIATHYTEDEAYYVFEISDKKGDLVLKLSTATDDKFFGIIIYGPNYPKPKTFKKVTLKANKQHKNNIKKPKK